MYSILIVDDDKIVVDDIISLISWERIGCIKPDSARDGEEALDMMRKVPYDIVITDISMPRLDGVELIRQAKQEKLGSIFVIISNFDDFIYVKEAMKLGAQEYLLKYQIDENNLTREILRAQQVIQTIRAGDPHQPAPGMRLEIRQAVEYIRRNYSRQISIDDLASKARLSPHYFCTLFKQETGTSYSEYIKQIRLNEVERMLKNTSMRTNEIAAKVGFTDYKYFCRFFRKSTGMTCSEYRRRYLYGETEE